MLEYLYQALASDYGIKLQTSSVDTLRAKLYAVRREARDEALDALALVPSPTDPSVLWVLRKPNGPAKK